MSDLFGGYYFKSQSGEKTLAVIAAFHQSSAGSGGFSVQLISDSGVWSAGYHKGVYSCSRKSFRIEFGDCVFTEHGIRLDIRRKGLDVRGVLNFKGLTPIKYDIMGPFKYVPFMECRHTVVSMRHRVDGIVVINGERFEFDNAAGYIEGDRGRSFPKTYSWTQCCFEGGSLMLSVADIPLGPLNFKGVIGVVKLGDKEHRIATYLGARAVKIGGGRIVIKQGRTQFTARLIKKRSHPLAAPADGTMIRTIHESASCTAAYRLVKRGRVLLDLKTDKASFEYEFPE